MSGSATGIDGLGSRHQWCELDLTALLTLGDLSIDPLYKLLEIPGFYSTPDLDDNRSLRTGTFGERLTTSYARGKTFEYHGMVQGSTRDACLVGKTDLMAAFGPDVANGSIVPERRMIVTPHTSLTPADEPPLAEPHTFVAVCRAVHIDDTPPRRIKEESEPPRRWALAFTLEMRITDGLFYEWDPVGHTTSNPKYA